MATFRTRAGHTATYSESDYNLGTLTRQYVDSHKLVGAPEGCRELTEMYQADLGPRMRNGFAAPIGALGLRRRSLNLSNSAAFAAMKLPPTGDFTDVLRSKAVVGQLGGRFASFFDGADPVAIPAKTAATAVAWIADGAPAPAANFTASQDDEPGISKTLAASMLVARKVWISTDDEVHAYILGDLSAGFAAEVDRAVIAGAGALEPTGLLNLAGVPSGAFGTNGGPPTRDALVAAVKAVGNANGESAALASMGWLTSPDGEAKLRLTDASAGDSGAWLWDDSDRILGKPAVSTTSVPNDLTKGSGEGLTALAYGNWGDVLVNHGRAVQISVDPRTYLEGGMVRITAFLDVKIVFRHKPSFYVFKDMSTS